MMMDVWILLTGALVATSSAILGCFLILRKMAMVGDAISHAVLPGIVIAFLVMGTRDSLPMLLGASVFGMITVILIQWFKNSGVPSDASIGVVFTALFSIGVILVSLYASHVDLDLNCVLFGEIGLVPFDRLWVNGSDVGPKAVWGLLITLMFVVLVITLFYKQFKLSTFDPGLAVALGIPAVLFHYVLMGLVSMTAVASFESVGAILVVGMLVVPPATAYLLTDRLSTMIVLSIVIGILSSTLGYVVSYALDASIAGCMVSVAGLLFALTFVVSPKHGLLKRYWTNKMLKLSA